MSIQKLKEVYVHTAAALDADDTVYNVLTSQVAIVGGDMKALNPAGGDTISTQPEIAVVNKFTDGTFKRSFGVKGTSLSNFKGESYAPAQRNVWAIGYNRKTLAGALTVAASTEYEFSVRFKNDKSYFSERNETLRINFISAAGATQETIADQIVASVNSSGHGSSVSGMKTIVAVKVDDGGGNFGAELVGLDIDQFFTTSYEEKQVYFSVHADNSTGFGLTPATEVQALSKGTGTYNQVYSAENKASGKLNRTLWPVPETELLSSAAGSVSGALTATGSITATEDVLTLSGAEAGVGAGSIITVGGESFEIKYAVSATVYIVNSLALATHAAAALTATAFYDVFNIAATDSTVQDGSGSVTTSTKTLKIFSLAIDAGAGDMVTASAGSQDLMDILNGWMATTPLAPAAVVV